MVFEEPERRAHPSLQVKLADLIVECSKNNLGILKSWQLMNLYTDVIWFYFLKKSEFNISNQNEMIVRAKKLIKQQKQ